MAAFFVAPQPAAAAPAGPGQVWAAQEAMNLAVTWAPPVDRTGVTGYRVTTSPATTSVDVPVGTERAVLPHVPLGTAYTVRVASLAGAASSAATDALAPVTLKPLGGSLHAIPPVRIADTRTGVPSTGPTNSITVPITGAHGIPSSGVGSVVLNVTVTGSNRAGFVTAYPSQTTRPEASNLNYLKGQTVAGLVVVPVGADGAVTLYSLGAAQLVVDADGWFSTADTSSQGELFHGLTPARLMDTRSGLGASTPGAGATIDLKVTGAGGVPTMGVGAVVLNLTVAGSTAAGFVTAYPKADNRPLASTLNFAAGQIVANRVIVPVGVDGKISLYNLAGRTPLVADVTGWFGDGSDPAAGGAYFVGVTPTRVADLRTAGGPQSMLLPGQTATVTVAGNDLIPTALDITPPTGVIATLTAIAGSPGFLTAFPSDKSRPTASDVNFPSNANVANLVIGRLGPDGATKIYNSAGYTGVLVDVSGYFVGDSSPSAHLSQNAVDGYGNAVAADGAGHLWASSISKFGVRSTRDWATVNYWNGTSWSASLLPEPAGALATRVAAVAVAGPSDVWAAGNYQTIIGTTYVNNVLIEHWDGTAWHLSAAPLGGSTYNTGIRGLVALGPDDVWAVGSERTGTQDDGLVLHWNGSTWTQVDVPDSISHYESVAADHQGGVVAIGEADNGAYVVTVLGRDAVLPVPAESAGTPPWLFGVTMTSATDGWVVGEEGTTAFHWTDGAWQKVSLAAAGSDLDLRGVAGTGPTDVWAVGAAIPEGSGQFGQFQAVAEHWNGSAWSTLAVPRKGTYTALNSVAAIGGNNVWAVGGTSDGYHTQGYAAHWNGTAWTTAVLPLPTVTR